MDYITEGAALVAAVTGISTWYSRAKERWKARKEQKAVIERRTWHGYIEVTGIDTWYVRLADEQPDRPTSKVVLEVIDRHGNPDEMGAHNVRQRVIGDGTLSRSPTQAEMEFLMALRKERGYGKGDLIR